MFGSLLCFSNDKFNTVLFATVAEYDVHSFSRGLIQIRPESHLDGINSIWRRQKFLAVESPAFFEASRHVLAALQTSNLQKFPLCKYIVSVEKTVDVPGYLKAAKGTAAGLFPLNHLSKETLEKGVKLVGDPRDENSWPPCENLGMDEAQYKAFKAALSRQLFICQGQ